MTMQNIRLSRLTYPRANGSAMLLLTAWIALLTVAIAVVA